MNTTKTNSVLGTFSSSNQNEMKAPGYPIEPVSKTNVKNSPNPSNMMSSTEMKSHMATNHFKTH